MVDQRIFWAACTLAYFWFLCSEEFTVPSLSSFSPQVHLIVQRNALDFTAFPSCMWANSKASKTDPVCKGCKGTFLLCPFTMVIIFWSKLMLWVYCFYSKMVSSSLVSYSQTRQSDHGDHGFFWEPFKS